MSSSFPVGFLFGAPTLVRAGSLDAQLPQRDPFR
jgi:hypothetical protein